MLFSVLIYNNETLVDALSKEEMEEIMSKHGTFHQHTKTGNNFGAAVKLMSTGTALTMHRDNNDVVVTDGPFAETKEQFLGLYLIEYPTLEDAMEAVKLLPIEHGRVEIRPVDFFEGADFRNGERMVVNEAFLDGVDTMPADT
ncbi:MAG: YciI family protein [Roseibium sp.]